MVEVADDRHFVNPWTAQNPDIVTVTDAWKQSLADNIFKLEATLSENLDNLSSSDISMYTGLSGIGLLYHRFSSIDPRYVSEAKRTHFASIAHRITRRCLRHTDLDRLQRNVSVFTSSIGPLCLGALITECSYDEKVAIPPQSCVDQIVEASRFASNLKYTMPDEALYGRTGYLNALLLLRNTQWSVPIDVISKVAEAILQSGIQTAEKYRTSGIYKSLMRRQKSPLDMPPLMYEWHEKAYLGAAHGFAGILLTLLRVHQMNPEALKHDSLQKLVLPTIHWLAELQLTSGNWPSSLGDSMDRDVLVHWCHGATGVVPLMLAAYEVTQDDFYLKRAIRGGETIWTRGLLYKGCGLCHGSAGSGYALAALHHVTGDNKYLYRAAKYAEWCTDCFKNRTRTADRPYSLFEGLAGTLYFLVEMLDPLHARFPLLR
ncbi:unnamed protein product [Dicrocoelium dendriticum]|nr:unnamed protein product [Dicrocoelium dendriticum]